MNIFLLAAAQKSVSKIAWGTSIGFIIILAFSVFILALIITCLIRVSRYFKTAGPEQKLLRMELGKAAEEIHLLRQELKDSKSKESPADS